MHHQLTIEVADDVYQPLVQRTQAQGSTPEAVALEIVTRGISASKPGELLRRWIGAFDTGVSDVAERHDEYLGQALYDELQGK